MTFWIFYIIFHKNSENVEYPKNSVKWRRDFRLGLSFIFWPILGRYTLKVTIQHIYTSYIIKVHCKSIGCWQIFFWCCLGFFLFWGVKIIVSFFYKTTFFVIIYIFSIRWSFFSILSQCFGISFSWLGKIRQKNIGLHSF